MHSTPMNAHSVKFSVAPIALKLLVPDTFQPAKYTSLLNQNQPNTAIPRIGTSAKIVVTDCTRPTTFGPRMFAYVNSQITKICARANTSGPSGPGRNA